MTIRNGDAPAAQNYDINSGERRSMISEALSDQTLEQITFDGKAIVFLGNGETKATMADLVLSPQQGKKTIG